MHRARARRDGGAWPWSATRATATSSASLDGRAFLHAGGPGVSYKHRCSSMPPTTSSSPVTSRAAAGIRCAPTARTIRAGHPARARPHARWCLRDRADSRHRHHRSCCRQKLRSDHPGALRARASERKGLVGHRVLLRLQARRSATTPTSSWTCASCRTPITIRSCGRLTGLDAPVQRLRAACARRPIEFEQKWHDASGLSSCRGTSPRASSSWPSAWAAPAVSTAVGGAGRGHGRLPEVEGLSGERRPPRPVAWLSAVTTCSARATTCWTPAAGGGKEA